MVASRSDGVCFYQPIALHEEEQQVLLTVPTGNSTVRGMMSGELRKGGGVLLWREDKRIVATVNAKENGVYEVNGLPEGTYKIGSLTTIGEYILKEFILYDGQSVTIDIDTPGIVLIKVADENGNPLSSGVSVWLEGAGRRVDGIETQNMGYVCMAEPGNYVLKVSRGGKVLTQNVVIGGGKQGSASMAKNGFRSGLTNSIKEKAPTAMIFTHKLGSCATLGGWRTASAERQRGRPQGVAPTIQNQEGRHIGLPLQYNHGQGAQCHKITAETVMPQESL